MSNSRKTALVLAAVCAFSAPGLHAGSVMGNGGALEVTQWLNGSILGKQLVEVGTTAKTVVDTLGVVRRTYEEAQRQGKALMNVGELLTVLKEIESYKSQVRRVMSDVEGMEKAFSARSLEATLARLPFDKYLERQAKLLKDGDVSVRGRIDRERELIAATNADIELAKKMGDKIAGQAGMHESIGLLNSQMNALLQTNIKIADAIQGQSRDKTGELVKEQMTLEDEAAARDKLNAAFKRKQDAQFKAIGTLTPATTP